MIDIINTFREYEDKKQAISMAKYMKNQFVFLGIKTPKRRELQKDFFKSLNKNEPINKVWILQLWSYEYREFQYLALDYLVKKKNVLTLDCMGLIETLIITKSWWDTVDILASHIVGSLCEKYPNLIEEYILKWAVHENMWLRRASILYQLKYKKNLNKDILEYAIMENCYDDEFFIKKAIGWALREYSKINPKWVKDFIEKSNLSKLSIKEASRYLYLES